MCVCVCVCDVETQAFELIVVDTLASTSVRAEICHQSSIQLLLWLLHLLLLLCNKDANMDGSQISGFLKLSDRWATMRWEARFWKAASTRS